MRNIFVLELNTNKMSIWGMQQDRRKIQLSFVQMLNNGGRYASLATSLFSFLGGLNINLSFPMNFFCQDECLNFFEKKTHFIFLGQLFCYIIISFFNKYLNALWDILPGNISKSKTIAYLFCWCNRIRVLQSVLNYVNCYFIKYFYQTKYSKKTFCFIC